MDKKMLALAILIVCIVSLFLGLLLPKKDTVSKEGAISGNKLFENIENVGDRIALLNIEGAISSNLSNNTWTDDFSLETFLNTIEKIEKDNKVKAVVIRINSPGGTVAASQDVYDAILRLREKKPVVASMADVAASGGYYIASAADYIVAQKGTMTGSIGVIFNFVDVAGLAEKLGVTSNVVKSGKYKDAGSLYRKMSQDEKELFQASVSDAYRQFVSAIEKGRVERKNRYSEAIKPLTKETLQKYADGRVFLGDKAYELGFVDKIGSQYDAQILASKISGNAKILPLVPYGRANSWKNFLMGIESRTLTPLKEILPFSYKYSSTPLIIWE